MERSPTNSGSSDSLVITGRVGYLLQEFGDVVLLQGGFLALEVGVHQTRIVGQTDVSSENPVRFGFFFTRMSLFSDFQIQTSCVMSTLHCYKLYLT